MISSISHVCTCCRAEYFSRGATALALLRELRSDVNYEERTCTMADPESWEIVFPRARYARAHTCLQLFLGNPCGACPAEAMAGSQRGGTHDAAWLKLRALLSETRGDPIIVRYLAAVVGALRGAVFERVGLSGVGPTAHLLAHAAFADAVSSGLQQQRDFSPAAEEFVEALARVVVCGTASPAGSMPPAPLPPAATASFRDILERCCNTLGEPDPPQLATCLLRFMATSCEVALGISRELCSLLPTAELFPAPLLSAVTAMAAVGSCGCVLSSGRCSSIECTPVFIGGATSVLRAFRDALPTAASSIIVAHVDLVGALVCRGCAAIDTAVIESGVLRPLAVALVLGRLRGIAACKCGLLLRYIICNRGDDDELLVEILHALDDATAHASPRASADLRSVVADVMGTVSRVLSGTRRAWAGLIMERLALLCGVAVAAAVAAGGAGAPAPLTMSPRPVSAASARAAAAAILGVAAGTRTGGAPVPGPLSELLYSDADNALMAELYLASPEKARAAAGAAAGVHRTSPSVSSRDDVTSALQALSFMDAAENVAPARAAM